MVRVGRYTHHQQQRSFLAPANHHHHHQQQHFQPPHNLETSPQNSTVFIGPTTQNFGPLHQIGMPAANIQPFHHNQNLPSQQLQPPPPPPPHHHHQHLGHVPELPNLPGNDFPPPQMIPAPLIDGNGQNAAPRVYYLVPQELMNPQILAHPEFMVTAGAPGGIGGSPPGGMVLPNTTASVQPAFQPGGQPGHTTIFFTPTPTPMLQIDQSRPPDEHRRNHHHRHDRKHRKRRIEKKIPSAQLNIVLCCTLLGFLFPLFWLCGACIWRKSLHKPLRLMSKIQGLFFMTFLFLLLLSALAATTGLIVWLIRTGQLERFIRMILAL